MRLGSAVLWALLPMSAAAQPVPGTRDVTFHEDGVAEGILSPSQTSASDVQDDTPEDEGRYRARFALDPRDFDPGEAQEHKRSRTFLAFAANPQRRGAAIVLRRLNGAYAVMGRARLDNNAQAGRVRVAPPNRIGP